MDRNIRKCVKVWWHNVLFSSSHCIISWRGTSQTFTMPWVARIPNNFIINSCRRWKMATRLTRLKVSCKGFDMLFKWVSSLLLAGKNPCVKGSRDSAVTTAYCFRGNFWEILYHCNYDVYDLPVNMFIDCA